MTWLLGLTGSIGMGKSTTAGFFREAGVPVWDADAAVEKLYGPGGAAVGPVEKAFHDALEGERISKDRLREALRAAPARMEELEAIVHPLVARDRQSFIAQGAGDILLFDIPLLFETGADAWLNSVLVVSAPAEVQRARVLARPGMTEELFESLLTRQMPDAEKRRRADHVIDSVSLDETRRAVRSLIAEIRE